MIIEATLEISDQTIEAELEMVQVASGGGYDRGYEDGEKAGYTNGYEIGAKEGAEVGYAKGKTDAETNAIALVNEGIAGSGAQVEEADSIDQIPNKIQDVYGFGRIEGKQAEYDAFWDAYQQNGNRTNYNLAFGGAGWTDETFKPKYPIAPVGNAATENTFYASEITNIPDGLLDFSQVTYCYMTFRKSKLITSPPLDLSNCTAGTSWLFGQCANLKKIKTLKVSEKVTYDNLTYNCYALEKITFEGTIGKNISFQFNPLLTNESVQSIIDHLKDLTGTTAQTLTFHATVGANLTDTQKAAISAKNWTLVY